MNPVILSKACGIPFIRAQAWSDPIGAAIERFAVRNVAMFLAQVAHECARFTALREFWGPTVAQARYSIRADLGNTDPRAIEIAQAHGDTVGHWYRGAGCIQLTGYANVAAFSQAMWGDDRAAQSPALLTIPVNAAETAGWFWWDRHIDAVADPGDADAFVAVTRRINGGVNGLQDRLQLWAMAKRALATA